MQESAIVCNALHPGVIYSNLMNSAGGWLRLIGPVIRPFVLNTRQGAETSLHLACSDATAGISGCYFTSRARPAQAAPIARDTALQDALWEASVQWLAGQGL